jgi:hypothetical protein
MMNKLFFCFYIIVTIAGTSAEAQDMQSDGRRTNNIQTGAPFLLITPDARSGGMGDVGVATSPDANSSYWNSAKLAFMEDATGLSVSYTPWLRNLVNKVYLSYGTIYHRLDERNTIAASLRYFSYGSIQLTDENQNDMGVYSPNEFSIDASFSRRYGENFSLGTAVRYIKSSLTNGQFDADNINPSTAFAADVSAYFKNATTMFGKDTEIAFGLNISNIGTKMNRNEDTRRSFLPANMKLGGAATLDVDALSKFTVALDMNKLLVPTNPIRDDDGNIIQGSDPERSVPAGIFGSFSDAPGGFSEELSEISYSLGTEYWYNNQFAVRSGYFYETPTKGDRRYFTLGAGFKSNVFNIDLAYLLANQSSSPLAQTLRFSLAFNFGR